MNAMDTLPLSLIVEPIEVAFNQPPSLEKAPHCPDSFTWRGETYPVLELLAEWHDYRRRGRMARNMQPQHAAAASARGSIGVGRFHFRVRVPGDRIFEIYYDRSIKNADDRKGHWYLMGERKPISPS